MCLAVSGAEQRRVRLSSAEIQDCPARHAVLLTVPIFASPEDPLQFRWLR